MVEDDELAPFFEDIVTPQVPPLEKRKRGRPRKVHPPKAPAVELADRFREPWYWPTGKPLRDVYVQRQTPCPRCRRLLLDTMSQAVCVMSTQRGEGGVAYLRCRACDFHFKLPIVRE